MTARASITVSCVLLALLLPAVVLAQITPVPPANYVMPGRTYDPAEPLVTPVQPGARTFHVSLAGNDNDPGTAAQPFRTIQRGLDALALGNDAVLIHGGLYRERIQLLGVGAPAGSPFVIGPAGDGEVIVDASTAVTGWTSQGGNIYRAAPGFAVGNVVIDSEPFYRETSLAALQAAPTVAGVPIDRRFFYDSGSGNLDVARRGRQPRRTRHRCHPRR